MQQTNRAPGHTLGIEAFKSSVARRGIWASFIVIAVLVPWAVLCLMAREFVSASIEATNKLFIVTLPVTYVGLWMSVIVASRDRRTMLYRGLAATVTLAVMLAIVEIPAALRLVHWNIILRRVSGEGMDYGIAYVHDAALSFRRIPGLTWSARPASDIEQKFGMPRTAQTEITFTFDKWGYRNATEMARADVVLIGDSYVEGWYVSDEQTVAAQLSARLGVPVANLGVAGYGSMQELIVLRTDALARQPRAIVWFFFEGNDLYNDHEFENDRLAPPPTPGETVPHREGLAAVHRWKERSFTLNAVRWLRRWSHPLVPNRAPYWGFVRDRAGRASRIYFADYAGVPWTKFEEEQWLKAQAAFEEGLSVARSRGIDLTFVYVPIKFRVYQGLIEIPTDSPMRNWTAWSELPMRFRSFCTSMSATCVDLTRPFREAAQQGVAVYARTDTHWSPAGHALAARELEALLRDRRLVQPAYRRASNNE